MSFHLVRERALRAMERAGRNIETLTILPVSKGQELEHILKLMEEPAFPPMLGESYLKELQEKLRKFPEHRKVEWHYLGALQSRKLAEIFTAAQVVHSVSRLKELEWISKNCLKKKTRFFLQVNVSGEKSKSGFSPDFVKELRVKVEELGLQELVEGLMTIASPLEQVGESVVRKEFAHLRQLQELHFSNKRLNMGMSDDFELAIAEGAHLLRIGSSIFGPRNY